MKIHELVSLLPNFKSLGVIKTTTSDFEYHVTCKSAFDDRTVLIPLRDGEPLKIVFVVSYHSTVWDDDSESNHWAISLDFQANSFVEYVDCQGSTYRNAEFENFVNIEPNPKFYTCGWSSCTGNRGYTFNYNANGEVATLEVADFLNELQKLLEVDTGLIHFRLLPTYWSPYFTFKGSENRFWSMLKNEDPLNVHYAGVHQ